MHRRRIALSVAVCLAAAALFADEPECAINYHSDGKSAETFVLTSLKPQDVIEQLPGKLIAAGASMQTSEPKKGVLKAEGLDVKAEVSGSATRVTFRLASAADKTELCRFASLVGNPPVPPVPQDPALIAQIKDNLIKLQRISQPKVSFGLSTATFTSKEDFLELTIKSVKQLDSDKRQYEISMLLPHAACVIASEAIDEGAAAFGGRASGPPGTNPVRVEALLIYIVSDDGLHLTEATITHIESTK